MTRDPELFVNIPFSYVLTVNIPPNHACIEQAAHEPWCSAGSTWPI